MKDILSHFAIPNEVAEPEPLRIGFINDSFVVRAKRIGEKSYCLQRINHHIFKDVEGLMRNIQLVTTHIRRKLMEAGEKDVDRKVLQLVPTTSGQLYYETPEGDYWRLYVLVEPATSQEKVTPASARLTGEAFGRFQRQLADLPFGELCESIPNFHNMEFRLQQLDEALAADPVGRKAACTDIIDAINSRREEMCLAERLFREGKLPKHINHCDTKVNNVLFDEEGKPICIVDLDTVMPGFVFSDFGDFMRTAANTGAEDDPILDNIRVDLEVFEAYARGYLKEATFLTEVEKELLPYGCRLLTYMQTVRFFTDWINGDTYYKIAYPEHNIVRTRAQLRLLEEQEKSRAQMEQIIAAL
ncbi:MAG: aminoglycoside phosphotransferase family protein [Paludibacteraceae bacterium]|nr:aminoglycoside phosphotransferase family protein [Paludibacteraceae bacterium]MBR4264415.1 aminoglycoside phosphotransferase family protein [Paludibacteraceae bacterium]